MSFSAETYALSKKYTNDSISGISGTLAGKNCTIQSITDIEGGHRVTFQWTADDSTTRTQTMDVMDGSGAEAIEQIYADNGILGAKNLLPYPYVDSTKTVDSVTFTDNGDGSVSLSGTASANPEFRITPDIADNRYKGMILTSQGGSSTASGAYVRVRVGDISSGSFIREVVGSEIIIPEMASNEKYYIAIRVTQGTDTSGIRIYPMLRLASDPDDTYAPPAMTNRELTEKLTTKELSSTENLDNLIHEGKYKWGSSYPVNAPENTTFANMEVQSLIGIIVIQKVFRNAVIYTRTYNGVWGSWTKFTGTEVS